MKEPSISANYECASKIPCIVPSFASRCLSCLCGAWCLWRRMRETHWGKGTIGLQAVVPKRPHMRPLTFYLHFHSLWDVYMFQDDTVRPLTIQIRLGQNICCPNTDHSMYSWTHGSSSAPYADSGTSHGRGNGMFLSFGTLSPSRVKTGSFICTNK